MEQQTIAQLEQNVAELLAKTEEMKQLIEKAKKEETWPINGDGYWYTSGDGFAFHDVWEDSYIENARKKLGNVHRSREDAELYVQKRLVQVELEQLAEKAWKASGIARVWDTKQHKYHLYYDTVAKDFRVDHNIIVHYVGQVFFPTEDSAAQAIATIGEERLKVLLK